MKTFKKWYPLYLVILLLLTPYAMEGTGKIDNPNKKPETTTVSPTEYLVKNFAGFVMSGFRDDEGAKARFDGLTSICIDNKDNLYVTDANNRAIRKISPEGIVTTLVKGSQFWLPWGITIDPQGNLFVVDNAGRLIKKITPDGNVTLLAGRNRNGFKNGNGKKAVFNNMEGIAIDSKGNLFVADRENHKIRKITQNGDVTTFAGSKKGVKDGTGTEAKFIKPFALEIDKEDNLYTSGVNMDGKQSNRIRKITPQGIVSTLEIKNDDGSPFDISSPDLSISKDGSLYFRQYFTLNKTLPNGEFELVTGDKSLTFKDDIKNKKVFNSRGFVTDSKGNIFAVEGNRIIKIYLKK